MLLQRAGIDFHPLNGGLWTPTFEREGFGLFGQFSKNNLHCSDNVFLQFFLYVDPSYRIPS